MRIDRSRIRVIRQLEVAVGGIVGDPSSTVWATGCVLGYGPIELEAWPIGCRMEWLLRSWLDRRLGVATADWREIMDVIEGHILEAVAGLSAHQRIAMVREGLLIQQLPHPGA